jgi:hypothetical protein
MSKTLSLRAPAPRPFRPFMPVAARALGAASMLLGRLAAELNASAAPRLERELPPVLEFYADASAPEGALYLNGELVGYLSGRVAAVIAASLPPWGRRPSLVTAAS